MQKSKNKCHRTLKTGIFMSYLISARLNMRNFIFQFEQEKLSSMEICTKCPNVTLNIDKFYHNTKVYSWVKRENVEESYKYIQPVTCKSDGAKETEAEYNSEK